MKRLQTYSTPVPVFILMLASILFILPSGRGAWAQTGTISGRVVEQGGDGVPYASVLLKGTPMGTVTNTEGNFRILKVPVGAYMVIARGVGFVTSEPFRVQVSADHTAIVDFKLTMLPLRLRADAPFLVKGPEDFPGESEFVYYEDAAVPITRPQPGYPEFAREAGIRGEVLLHMLVGRDGRVKDVKVLRGVTGLNEAAIQTAKNWVFKPALSNNKPVAVWIEVPFHFPP